MSPDSNGPNGQVRFVRHLPGLLKASSTLSSPALAPRAAPAVTVQSDSTERGAVASTGIGVMQHAATVTINKRAPTVSDFALGKEIRELRRSQGKTQKDLARMVGVTGAQLHRYETGATRIAASRLIAIADALGTSADLLISAGSVGDHGGTPQLHSRRSADDIVELIQVFGSISDPKHRSALVAVARMMATHYQRSDGSDDAE